MPSGDGSSTADGPRSDKLGDKLSDKLTTQDRQLLALIEAWPKLPQAVRQGILAMVQAFTRKEDR